MKRSRLSREGFGDKYVLVVTKNRNEMSKSEFSRIDVYVRFSVKVARIGGSVV